MPGVAAGDAFYGHPRAVHRAMAANCIIRVLRTGRKKAATGSQHRTQKVPVHPDKESQKGFQDSELNAGPSFSQFCEAGLHPPDRIGRRLQPIWRAYQQVYRAKTGLTLPERLTDTTLDSIAIRCACRMLSGNKDAEPRRTRGPRREEERETADIASRTASKQGFEIRARTDTLVPAKSFFMRCTDPGHAAGKVARDLRQPSVLDPAHDAH